MQDRRKKVNLTKRVSRDPRRDRAEPWTYGPYRVVVTRRVTEEEQISVECYEPTLAAAVVTYDCIMESMRQNMVLHNERVWATHQKKMGQLERMIEVRGEHVRQLDGMIRERRDWLIQKGMDVSDIPLFEDDPDEGNTEAH